MPLSEEEQRILSEIEQQFYEQDPAFARQVGTTTVYSHGRRNLKWAAVGFLLGLAIMVTSFASSLFLGVAGFALMLASAVVFERNLRRLGKVGLKSLSESVHAGMIRTALGDARTKLRDRFRRSDD